MIVSAPVPIFSPLFSVAADSTALMIYAMIGPLTWVAFVAIALLAYGRMRKFRRPRLPLPDTPPTVTVLIPAKDEGDGIRACLERVLEQDYPNFTILAVDDRSTDATGAVMDEMAAAHPERLRALHIPPGGLPPGWLGKCNALHTAAAHADAEWLLFVDSDVKLEPDALSTAVARAAAKSYDALSIMTRLETHTFWEKLILPLAGGSVGALTKMSLTNHDTYRSIAFANGQFFLIRRATYEEVGGHASVRDNITEDVALMRLMKGAGKRCRLYYGRDFASTRMHTTLPAMFNGWSRIYSGVTHRRALPLVAAMLFVAICGLSAYVVLAASLVAFASTGRSDWLILSLLHVTIMTIALMGVYQISGNRKRYALAFPIGGAVLIAIYAAAVRTCRTGRIAWRGTSYTAGTATSSPPPPAPPPPPPPVESSRAASPEPEPEPARAVGREFP